MRNGALIVALLLALGALAVGVVAATRPTARPVAPASPPASERAADGAAAAAADPSGARAIEEAIKQLDLIRPARPKLAEDFSLRLVAGKSFRLSEHRGKVVMVNFWATWCLPCREEMPAMEQLYQRHREHGFVMLAVSVDANPALVPAFVAEHKLTFPVALDAEMTVAGAWGVRALPSSFIIDRHGYLAALALGPRAWDATASHALIEAMTRR